MKLIQWSDNDVEVLGDDGSVLGDANVLSRSRRSSTFRPNPLVSEAAKIARAISRSKLRPPLVDFEVLGRNSDYIGLDITGCNYHIIGAETAVKLPLFQRIKQAFVKALPSRKKVRVDDEKTYRKFRDIQRVPYIKKLEERLIALESSFAKHCANHHGERFPGLEAAFEEHIASGREGYDVGDSQIIGDDIVRLAPKAVNGGKLIPVSPSLRGKVEGWQDGPIVYISVKFLGANGRPVIATGADYVDRYVDEVLDTGMKADLDYEVLGALAPGLSQALAGAAIFSDLCCAAPDLTHTSVIGRGSIVGELVPRSDPEMSAVMMLIQRCRQGDKQALVDINRLLDAGYKNIISEACERTVCCLDSKRR